MRPHFKLNPKALAELATSEDMQKALLEEAEKVAQKLGPEYSTAVGNKSDRVRARVYLTDEKKAYKELAQGGEMTQFVAKNGSPE